MSLIRYTRNHEWIEVEGEIGTVGITERWLAERGEVVYVELPEIGDEYEKEEPIALVESMDGTEYQVLAPVTGEVVEINEELEDDVDLINRSPEGDGWLFKMRIEMRRELKSLMNLDEYEDFEEEDYEEFEITDLGEEELL